MNPRECVLPVLVLERLPNLNSELDDMPGLTMTAQAKKSVGYEHDDSWEEFLTYWVDLSI